MSHKPRLLATKGRITHIQDYLPDVTNNVCEFSKPEQTRVTLEDGVNSAIQKTHT